MELELGGERDHCLRRGGDLLRHRDRPQPRLLDIAALARSRHEPQVSDRVELDELLGAYAQAPRDVVRLLGAIPFRRAHGDLLQERRRRGHDRRGRRAAGGRGRS
jgi:hypothetical protein